jgi:hypothetical protein
VAVPPAEPEFDLVGQTLEALARRPHGECRGAVARNGRRLIASGSHRLKLALLVLEEERSIDEGLLPVPFMYSALRRHE